MFIRSKKVKNQRYAYLVKNEWTKRGSRQKSLGYLGRIISPEKKDVKIQANLSGDFKNSVVDMIEKELIRHGFAKRDGKLVLDDIVYQNLSLKRKKKDVVLEMNEGFLCSHTIKGLVDFNPSGDESDGVRLAEAIVSAGLNIDKETFLKLFEKIDKPVMETERFEDFEY